MQNGIMRFFLTKLPGKASDALWQLLLGIPIYIAPFLGIGLFPPELTAQDAANTSSGPESPASSDEGWRLGLTPYLWFAGVHGTAGVLGREASVHADVSDVLSNFNIGFMGAGELRYNRLLFPGDFMWIKLTDNRALPIGENAASLKAVFKQAIFAPRIGYRIVDGQKIKVDWQMGIRCWHLDSSFSLQPSRLGRNFSGTADWVDGVSGGKIVALVSRKVIVTVGGDAGGGTARSDYQVYGLLGFRVSERWVLHSGYRYMSVDYRPENTFLYDLAMSGLILGATWNAK